MFATFIPCSIICFVRVFSLRGGSFVPVRRIFTISILFACSATNILDMDGVDGYEEDQDHQPGQEPHDEVGDGPVLI